MARRERMSPAPSLHFQMFVLLLVHLKSKVSALTNDQILFDRGCSWRTMTTPPQGVWIVPSPRRVDAVEKLRKKRDRSNGPISEVLPPEQACLATIVIERLLRVDSRLGAQFTRNGRKSGVAASLP